MAGALLGDSEGFSTTQPNDVEKPGCVVGLPG